MREGERLAWLQQPWCGHGAALKEWGQCGGGGAINWSLQQEMGRAGPSPQASFNV